MGLLISVVRVYRLVGCGLIGFIDGEELGGLYLKGRGT